jgi:hypothetical protein
MQLRDRCGLKLKSRSTCYAAVAITAACLLAAGCQPRDTSPEPDKQACAEIIQRAITKSSSRDEAERLVRTDPRARKVCSGLEMNGAPIIP